MSNFLNKRPNPNAVKTKWGWQNKNTGEHLVSAAGQFKDVEAEGGKKPNQGKPLSVEADGGKKPKQGKPLPVEPTPEATAS